MSDDATDVDASTDTSHVASLTISAGPPPWSGYVTGNRVLIWSFEVASILRQQFRIVGECLPSAIPLSDDLPHTKYYTSLPIHLSIEQAAILQQQGLIRLLDGNDIKILRESRYPQQTNIVDEKDEDDHIAVAPQEIDNHRRNESIQERLSYLYQQQSILHHQQTIIREDANNKRQRFSTRAEAIEKQNKRQKKREAQTESLVEVETSIATIGDTTETSAVNQSILSPSYPTTSTMSLAHQYVPDAQDKLYSQTGICVVDRVSNQPQHNPGSSSSSTRNRISDMKGFYFSSIYSVLHHLYHADAAPYLTQAHRYGGDYLIYPGDPNDYHSHSIVKVLDTDRGKAADKNTDDGISVLELLRLARIGHTVKKGIIIAEIQQKDRKVDIEAGHRNNDVDNPITVPNNEVHYITIHWEPVLSKNANM